MPFSNIFLAVGLFLAFFFSATKAAPAEKKEHPSTLGAGQFEFLAANAVFGSLCMYSMEIFIEPQVTSTENSSPGFSIYEFHSNL